MALSNEAVRRLMIALARKESGREVASAIDANTSANAAHAFVIAAAIVAAHTSTTTDFAALKAGDLVIHIPAVAGNADFGSIMTNGTLYEAAVVGDLYVALRAPAAAPAPRSDTL